jgi:hypothetical protein
MGDQTVHPSRSEREANLKDKAGWVITILAAFLAVNTLIGGSNSSKVLNNTIAINDTWAFYQAKSIKQTAYLIAAEESSARKDYNTAERYLEKVDSYESDPVTGEGKKELMEKAKTLQVARDDAKMRNPWFTYAGSTFQIAIVLLTASILAVSTSLFWGSIFTGLIGAALFSQAIWMWVPVGF